MMKLAFSHSGLCLAIAFSLVGCNQAPVRVPSVQRDTVAVSHPAERNTSFHLSHDTLEEGSSIVVYFPAEHPSKMAIADPSGTYFYLQDGTDLNLVSPAGKFAQLDHWTLEAGQQGAVYVEGNKQTKRIFDRKGVYKLILADNLETEPENTNFFETSIYFKGSSKSPH